MNELQICKKIAELEGVILINYEGVLCALKKDSNPIEYNPITDLAINCMLRDKYEIQVCYDRSLVIKCRYEPDYSIDKASFRIGLPSTQVEINRAVCECILKSRGLWDGD